MFNPLFLTFISLILMTMMFLANTAMAISPKAYEWYQKAQTALNEGNTQKAESDIRQAMTFDPYDPLLYISLGHIYHTNNNLDKAIEVYTRAAELDAKDPGVYYTLGTLYEEKQDYDKAINFYNISLQKNPSWSYAKAKLAKVLGFKQRYAEAITLYEGYLTDNPNDWQTQRQVARLALKNGNLQKAIDYLNYIKQTNPSAYQDEAVLAEAYLKANLPQQALTELQNAQARGLSSAEVADLKAQALEKVGNLNAAIVELTNLTSANPNEANYLFRLARLHYQVGHIRDGLSTLNRYLDLNPQDEAAQVARVIWSNKNGDFTQSKTYARNLLADLNVQADAKEVQDVKTEYAFALLKTGEATEAAKQYAELLASGTPDAKSTLKLNYAISLFESQQYESALAAFQTLLNEGTLNADTLLTVKKDVHFIYTTLAKRKLAQQELAEAQKLFENAKYYATSDEALESTLLDLAGVLVDQDETEAAINTYKEVLEQDDLDVEARLNLGRLLRFSDAQAALEYLEPLLEDEAIPLPLESQIIVKQAAIDAYTALDESDKAFELLQALKETKNEKGQPVMTAEHWNQLGNLYYGKQSFDEAKGAYQKALVHDTNYALAAYNLGTLYFKDKDFPKAKEAMLQAVKGDRPIADAFFALGLVEERNRNFAKAKSYYEDYLTKAKNLSEARIKETQSRLANVSKILGVTFDQVKAPSKAVENATPTKPDASDAPALRGETHETNSSETLDRIQL